MKRNLILLSFSKEYFKKESSIRHHWKIELFHILYKVNTINI